MDFVATIEKGAAGVGFGMVVVENAKAQIIAKVSVVVILRNLLATIVFRLMKLACHLL
jgi:hypothetical protein